MTPTAAPLATARLARARVVLEAEPILIFRNFKMRFKTVGLILATFLVMSLAGALRARIAAAIYPSTSRSHLRSQSLHQAHRALSQDSRVRNVPRHRRHARHQDRNVQTLQRQRLRARKKQLVFWHHLDGTAMPRMPRTGKVPAEKCTTCRGEGVYRKQEEIDIAVPAGIEGGEMVRLERPRRSGCRRPRRRLICKNPCAERCAL